MDNIELRAAAYGELYDSANTQMQMVHDAIEQRRGIGFDTDEECANWAHEHHLDIVLYSEMAAGFFHLTYYGKRVSLTAWKRTYSDVLFIKDVDDKGVVTHRPWVPVGFSYYDKARIAGEMTDGIHTPLHQRDYFTPTGFFDPTTSRFNTATPFKVFAKETGRDTSHIYTYIDNIAGECAPWLLAWLRAKIINPKVKTEVVPIIVSRKQGNGKSTFADVICKGLFGQENVRKTDQFDADSRFNSDYCNLLVLCLEEKEEQDSRVTAAALKSRSTNNELRVEHKGVDPIFMENYTEFVVTTNRDVPIKFDGPEAQRRFMVMGSNPDFTRENPLADSVFTKLYGKDNARNVTGTPFYDDKDLIAQFKHELINSEKLANVDLHKFPHTEEYQRCFTLPRTTENSEIDAIMRTLAPFILAALKAKKVQAQVTDVVTGEALSLSNFVTTPTALQYMPPYEGFQEYIAVCRPLVFYDQTSGKPFPHATVERGIIDCTPWLLADYGIKVLPSQLPIPGGFMGVMSRYRQAPAARFALADEFKTKLTPEEADKEEAFETSKPVLVSEQRIGQRLRVNSKWQPDANGEFETLNEMKPGVTTLDKKNENVQYLDTFLFEADDCTKQQYQLEQTRLKGTTAKNATSVYMERLRLQRSEAQRLLDEGKAFRVVYSGGKSYHILVRIKDAPQNIDEYKWLHAHLCDGVISDKLNFDPSCNDPARLTRAPITKERVTEYNGATVIGKQELMDERPNQVYDYNWRPLYLQWQNRPLDKVEEMFGDKRMRPMKQEFKDAMVALGSGRFWTDPGWNGRRQTCFFPAYRLLRLCGFSHEQLWSADGILDGLDSYYRKNEREYWRTRESSDIIKQIDADVQRQLEDE